MTTLREAAQQALEALEYYQHRRLEWDYSDEVAITALNAALAEPVQAQRKPLTEEEIDSIWDSEKAFADIYAIVRAIERAHGIT